MGHTYDSVESSIKVHESTLKELFEVQRVPGHSVIQRGMAKMRMSYIRLVIYRLVFRWRRAGMIIAVDSSGFSVSNSSTWFDIRIRRVNSRKECLKLHIAVDLRTGIIHHFTVSDWKRSDSKEFERLLKYLPSVEKVLGDKAYCSRENCEIVVSKGGKPFLLFKTNATGRARGSLAWKESHRDYTDNNDDWLATYHLRSIVEAVFSSIKRRWNSYIASRKPWLQRRELALKVLSYNLKQVLYNQRAEELGTSLWESL
jgi:transposase